MEDEIYDVCIIGAGGAGLTAAIYAVRSGLKTLVLEAKIAGGLATTAAEIENFPSYKKIGGMELMDRIKEHALKYVAIKELEPVEEARKEGDLFWIKTSMAEYRARAIIIATGADHKHLNVPGEKELSGRGVSYCATCDGYFYKGKKVLMVGGGSTALMDAIYLHNIGCEVTIVHRRDQFRAEKAHIDKVNELGIPVIWNSVVKEIKGDDFVKSVVLENVKTHELSEIEVDGVFIAIGQSPTNEVAKMLGVELDDYGFIKVDRSMRTSVPGVYAAGDITDGVRQLIVACGEGAVAATSAFEDISNPYWVSETDDA